MSKICVISIRGMVLLFLTKISIDTVNSESESHSVMSNSLRPPWTVVHGILQARVLVEVAIPISRGSSQPRD